MDSFVDFISIYINPLGLLAAVILLFPNLLLLFRRKRKRHFNKDKVLAVLRLLSGILCLVFMVVNVTGEQVSFSGSEEYAGYLYATFWTALIYSLTWIWYFVHQNIVNNALMEVSAIAIMGINIYLWDNWGLLVGVVCFAVTHTIIIVKTMLGDGNKDDVLQQEESQGETS